MTQLQSVQAMTDQELDMECGKVCGKQFYSISNGNCFVYLEEWEDPTMFQPSKKVYMTEVITSKAMEVDARLYAINLANCLKWDDDGDPLSYSDDDLFSYTGVCNFLQATPRQRAEAAYMTIKNQP